VGIKSNFAFDALPCFEDELHETAIRFEVHRVSELREAPQPLFHLSKAQGRNIYVVLRENDLFVGIGSFLQFDLNLSSHSICCQALSIVPDALLRYWFLQQVLPLYLLWNGSAEFLHGMAVSAASASSALSTSLCFGFLGDSHAGKSTLLSYFLSRGHFLVSDDHLAVSRKDHLSVLPATPYYRPYRAGEDLGFVAANYSPAPTRLRRLFLLEPAPGYADIEMHELQGLEAVSALLRHVQYNLHNLEAAQLFPLVAERFRGLTQLIRQVTVKRLYVPRSMERLAEVYNFIQQDIIQQDIGETHL
jgi:hypothetical protein